jgi:hypothetical protein
MAAPKILRRLAYITATLVILGYAGFRLLPYVGTVNTELGQTMGDPQTGALAPAFQLSGADGKLHTLSEYRGKLVVLEWTSPLCEFTAKHYASGQMQTLQKHARAAGAVWLAINSAGRGQADYTTPEQANARLAKTGSVVSSFLIDGDGKTGRLYGAKTTPSLYLIDAAGVLRYHGAVDNKPWGDGNPAGAQNYLRLALADIAAGKPVSIPATQPYGCSVHY